jgi:hypothetical protein
LLLKVLQPQCGTPFGVTMLEKKANILDLYQFLTRKQKKQRIDFTVSLYNPADKKNILS